MTRKALVSSSEQYSAEAQGEVCRRLPGASVGQALAPGLHLWDLATPFVDAASKLLRDRPVFVRHVAPVHRVVVLANRQDDDLQLIRTQVRDHLLGHFQPGLPFSVQHRVLPMLAYRPYEIQVALQDEVQEQVGLPVSVRDPQQVLSVVVSDAGGALEAHLGVSRTDHNLSAWPGGMRRFAREPDQVSRSEFKLLEALEAFGVTLDDAHHALDLGASPGGWTRILTGRGLRVVAVDPADLHPSVESHPLVTHLRATAGDAFSRRDLPVFDLVANDLRMEARHSAKLTVRAAGLLKPGAGTAIMTLKLPAKRPLRVLDDAMSILSARYRIRGARHLFHNRHEVTAHLSLT